MLTVILQWWLSQYFCLKSQKSKVKSQKSKVKSLKSNVNARINSYICKSCILWSLRKWRIFHYTAVCTWWKIQTRLPHECNNFIFCTNSVSKIQKTMTKQTKQLPKLYTMMIEARMKILFCSSQSIIKNVNSCTMGILMLAFTGCFVSTTLKKWKNQSKHLPKLCSKIFEVRMKYPLCCSHVWIIYVNYVTKDITMVSFTRFFVLLSQK